jgi:hypothetical protein
MQHYKQRQTGGKYAARAHKAPSKTFLIQVAADMQVQTRLSFTSSLLSLQQTCQPIKMLNFEIAHQTGDMIHSTLPVVPVHWVCQLQAPDGLVSCWWVWWVERNKHLGGLRGQVLHHNNHTYTKTSATSVTPYCSAQMHSCIWFCALLRMPHGAMLQTNW